MAMETGCFSSRLILSPHLERPVQLDLQCLSA